MSQESNLGIKTLKLFGFSSSEIKVYKILVENDYLQVSEIAKYAKIPRTKTYEVLKNLEAKNVLQTQQGQPIKYRAKDPDTTLKTMREKVVKETEKGLEILQDSWEQREELDDKNPVTVYYGTSNYYRLINGLESRPKANLFILIRYFMSEEDITAIKVIIDKNIRKGVKVELVLHPDAVKILDKKQLEYFQKETDLSIAPLPLRVIIIDNKELIIQIPTKGIQGNLDPEDIHNVILRLPDLVGTIGTSIRTSINKIKIKV